MDALQRILVPTDFSEHGEKAVRYGAAMAQKLAAELHLLHVVQPTPMMYEEGMYFPTDTDEQSEAAATQQLAGLQVAGAEGVNVIRRVVRGAPFVEILRYAKENSVNLIVIGTHGRGAIAHMLLGSVAERVVRKASCPVLVVRDQEHEFVMP